MPNHASFRARDFLRIEESVAFYIRKMANGKAVWLKRVGPAVIWGPKPQAINFATRGVARMTLSNIPKADKAEVVDDAAGEASAE